MFIENLYSPHMVVMYNKNSNGTKKIQWQCNVNISVTNVYYGLITWRSQRNKAYA